MSIDQTDIETIVHQLLVTDALDYRVFDATTHQTPTTLKRPLVVLKSAELEGDVLVVQSVVYAEAFGRPVTAALRRALDYGLTDQLSTEGLEVLSLTERREPAVHLPGGVAATVQSHRLEVAVHE
ncbi:hypothetical protein ACTXLB_06660 [Brachybacterium tyrofermentans]|uniref:hypothetical protein n=1 Tax=Brachybacterium tyrofermentans TaxID=47848 RepID=UPI003FD02929